MRIVKNNKRISVLGLIKFLAAIAIIFHHAFINSGHGTHFWLFVDLFFFITGYFTFKHFRKKKNRGMILEDKADRAIKYTIKKFSTFIPYVMIAVILYSISYIVEEGNLNFSSILIIPFNLTFLNSQINLHMSALWFLSAMLIVFPLFCLMCQTKNKRVLYIVLFTAVVVYYFNSFDHYFYGIQSLIRAFASMSTGVLVYATSRAIRHNFRTKKSTITLSVIGVLSLVLSLICLYPNSMNSNYTIYGYLFLLLTFVWLSILLSGRTIFSKISSPLFDYLERISMIIYLVHAPIIKILLIPELALRRRYVFLISLIISIILSILLDVIVSKIMTTRKSNKLQKNAQ